MTPIDGIRRLWEHLAWADARLLAALPASADAAPEALRELAHVVGTEETWLARLERRAPRAPVWPEPSREEIERLLARTHAAFEEYLAGLEESDLEVAVTYVNSAGDRFTSSVGDILLHVALHGQYHRGKVNLLLRQAGLAPAPTDYIAFVRGAPAATEATARWEDPPTGAPRHDRRDEKGAGMETREHVHEEVFPASQEDVFALLHTPSAIRQWWSAARAVVLPERGGTWAAAWGEEEDRPDYVTVATIRELDPPRRLVLADYRYWASEGPLPFEAEFVTEFRVEPHEEGAVLRVAQDGFPAGPEGDEFYAACETGWRDTFAGIRRYLASRPRGG